MTLPSPAVALVPVPDDKPLGYIGKLVVHGADVYAVGGTYHAPTILCSHDHGQTFERWPSPPTSGLRDLFVAGDRIWVVGEYGMIATTANAGVSWTQRSRASTGGGCLYAIERDPEGAFWVTGDAGLVLRSKTGAKFEVVKTKTKGRVLSVFIDPVDGKPWILDTTGTLQRWTGKQFSRVQAIDTSASLNEITRTRTGTLVVAANGGVVLRSANGTKWKRIPTRVRAMLETVHVSRYGIFVAGEAGVLLGSWDDAKTFTRIETEMTGHLWTIASVPGGLLIGGDEGRIYRITVPELAKVLHAVYTGHDEVLATLALRLQDGEEGAELVYEDALHERGLW